MFVVKACINSNQNKFERKNNMYLVPEPKQLKINDGVFYSYEINIIIDKNCGYSTFIAAKELKNTMKEANCGVCDIIKPLILNQGEFF